MDALDASVNVLLAKMGILEVQCRCTICGRMTTLKMGGHPTTCNMHVAVHIANFEIPLDTGALLGCAITAKKGFFGLQCRKPACMCSGASKTCMLPQTLSKFRPCPITRAWQLRGAPHLKPKLQGVSVGVVR